MHWLLEDLLGATEEMGFLWGPLTHALACSHCGHCCLHSPGHLVILFLFAIWQIQRWQQRESWRSGDMMTVKGLPLQYDFAFFDHLQKQKSEGEEERKEGQDEEAQSSSLDRVTPMTQRCPPKDAPMGDGVSAAPPQPPCRSQSLPKAPGTAEQTLPQPSGSSRSSPTFQISATLPVRNRKEPASCLQHRKGQFFYGLPSQHSESLETVFLGSDSASPLRLSVSSVFNNPLFLPGYNLLFLHYCSPTQLPTHDAHTREDLGGGTLAAQLVPPPSSSPVPPPSLHHKPLPVDFRGDLSDGEAPKLRLTQDREVLWESDDQGLFPQPELQGIRASKCLSFSEAGSGEVWHPRLHQHNPESSSISPLNPTSPLGVLTRFESPLRTMKQNEQPQGSDPVKPAPSASPAFLPELQTVSPTGALSGSKALWETREHKGDPLLSESLILAPRQATVPVTEPRGSSPPSILPGYEAQWETTGYKERPQVSEPSVLAPCQPPASLLELPKVSPTQQHAALKNFQGNMGYRDNPLVKSAMPALYSPPDSSSKFQERNPLKDSLGHEPQWGYRGNTGSPKAIEGLSLDLNPELHGTSPVCVPSGSEPPRKGTQSRDLWVSADLVSSSSLPGLPSAFLPQSLEMGPPGLLSVSKALWDTKGQKMHFQLPDSSETTQTTPLVPFVEQNRTNTVGGLPSLEITGKDIEHSRNSKASEPPSVALSPSPALVLEPLKVRVLSDEATCGNIQRKKNSWTSQLPAPSLLQDLHGATPLVVSDSEPVTGDLEQKENDCVPVSLVEGPRSLANSVPESHITETFGDQSKHKPAGEGVEPREKYRATELSAPSSLSTPLPEPHTDLKFLYKNVQQNKVPWIPGLPVRDLLHPVSRPPVLGDARKIEPAQCALEKGDMFAGAKAEVPSAQGQAIPEAFTHPEAPTWQWSRELGHRLRKLKKNPAFRSPGPSQPASLSSTDLDPCRLSPWALQKTHPPNLHLHSSCCHSLSAQHTAPQPVQASCCHHSPSSHEPHPGASGQAEQRSHKEERIKGKVVAQIPSYVPGFYKKAGEKGPVVGKASYTEVPASGKRQNKPLVLSFPKKRESPRKPKATEGAQRKARLGSPTVTGNSHTDQAQGQAEASVSRLSHRSQHKGRPSHHTALSQQLPKAAGSQERRRAGLVPGAIQNPQHRKPCPWAHMEKHLPSLTPRLPSPGISEGH